LPCPFPSQISSGSWSWATKNAPVKQLIEAQLRFPVTLVPGDGAREAIRGGADLGASSCRKATSQMSSLRATTRGLRMPIFLLGSRDAATLSAPYLGALDGVLIEGLESRGFYEKRLLAPKSNATRKPPHALLRRADAVRLRRQPHLGLSRAPGRADVPHHPAGRLFYQHMGENVFRDDICNAMVSLGDLLIHEGPRSRRSAPRRIFGADRTYFVLNGTSTSNKIVNTALLRKDDIVCSTATTTSRTITARCSWPRRSRSSWKPIAMASAWWADRLGGVRRRHHPRAHPAHPRLRTDRWKKPRPIRVAIIEQCTYDGTVYNARKVLEKIGHLCEYIHFDEAWAGLRALPSADEGSLQRWGLELKPATRASSRRSPRTSNWRASPRPRRSTCAMPTSQRTVSASSIAGSTNRSCCTSRRLRSIRCFPAWTSMRRCTATRPGACCGTTRCGSGSKRARRCAVASAVSSSLRARRGGVPGRARAVEDVPTDVLANEQRYWQLVPGRAWHGYRHLGEDAAMQDPTKLLLMTPGIDPRPASTQTPAVPATILANFLRENQVIPEKNDLNSILFLLTPAVGEARWRCCSPRWKLSRAYELDSPLIDGASAVEPALPRRYAGYTLRQLAQEMHEFYARAASRTCKRESFRYASFPAQAMSAREANAALVGGDVDLVPISRSVRPHRRHARAHLSARHRDHRTRRTLGRSGQADDRLLPRLRRMREPLPRLRERSPGRLRDRVDGRCSPHVRVSRALDRRSCRAHVLGSLPHAAVGARGAGVSSASWNRPIASPKSCSA
jgi:ornithine decarboxylase